MKEKAKNIKIILMASLVAALVTSACNQNQQVKQLPATVTASETKYTCPMHPQILEDHPGSCPICGMTLVKKSGQATEGAGVSLNTVLQPVNSSVISGITTVSPVQKSMPTQIYADGYLDFDTRTFNNIASRFSGRIEKLYIKYAFEQIYAGQRIFDIYSPDMVTAQQDLLFLIKNSPHETALIEAAKQKLLLLGMTDGQIGHVIKTQQAFYSLPVYSPYQGHVHDVAHSQMLQSPQPRMPTDYANNLPLAIKEGMYVERGQTLFNVVNPHQLWAVVKIGASDISGLKLNQPVAITIPDVPGKTITGKVNFIEPVLQAADKTTSIRVYITNMDHNLKVNTLVKAKIQTGPKTGLWIPKAALLNLGQAKIVWLKSGARFKVHQVNTATINGDDILITKGLSVTDTLASNAAYLTDSEGFIKIPDHEQKN